MHHIFLSWWWHCATVSTVVTNFPSEWLWSCDQFGSSSAEKWCYFRGRLLILSPHQSLYTVQLWVHLSERWLWQFVFLSFVRPFPLQNKERERLREREKAAREREARYSNGHLFTSLTVSGTTLCTACNKSITAKEALSCPSKWHRLIYNPKYTHRRSRPDKSSLSRSLTISSLQLKPALVWFEVSAHAKPTFLTFWYIYTTLGSWCLIQSRPRVSGFGSVICVDIGRPTTGPSPVEPRQSPIP